MLENIIQALSKKDNLKLYFILPSILFTLIMGTFPLVFMVYLAFNTWQPGSGGISWVGLRNFQNLLQDKRFFDALYHTAFIVVAAVAAEVVLGTIVAAFLQMRYLGRSLVSNDHLFANPVDTHCTCLQLADDVRLHEWAH